MSNFDIWKNIPLKDFGGDTSDGYDSWHDMRDPVFTRILLGLIALLCIVILICVFI